MYSDLFDALGANPGTRRGNSNNEEAKPLLSFKAGKMDMELQENGSFRVTPDTRRGELRIVSKNSATTSGQSSSNNKMLYLEWFDRREKTVVESHKLDASSPPAIMKRADTGRSRERVYYWKFQNEYHMYWMQDGTDEKDDEYIDKLNEYLKDPVVADAAGADTTTTSAAAASTSSSSNAQVDALSNILENLGMPQSEDRPAAAAAPGGTLTLADLQGAMAGLQQQQAVSAAAPPGPPLQELITPAAITALLENNEVRDRLCNLLPEDQQTPEQLEENLKSPQVQQTLRTLTAALLPDPDTANLDGYHSMIANFQLDPQDGEASLRGGNPIQAFLDCILAKVEKEQEAQQEGDDNQEQKKQQDEEKSDESKES